MNKTILLILIISAFVFASEHGIYLKVLSDAGEDFDGVVTSIERQISPSNFTILKNHQVAVPDLILKEDSEKCGYRATLFVLKNDEYTRFLTSFGNKYLVASFLKIGVYENEKGVQVNIIDPETINRIVFNDMDQQEYSKVIAGTKPFKDQLIALVHQLDAGKKVQKAMEPIRSDEDLWEASKDMFMMVGPMTFFKDESQFPQIFSKTTETPGKTVQELLTRVTTNIGSFKASPDDIDYQWSPNKSGLNWKIISRVFAPDSNAVVIGLSRPRTEALSFQIAGKPRNNDSNKCPGIDHLGAYPVEVLILAEKGKVVIHTAREMFRMDMYFWDAGKMAFMEYMNMPKMLDKSIKKALLGN